MREETIQLSTFGRHISIGSLYNYQNHTVTYDGIPKNQLNRKCCLEPQTVLKQTWSTFYHLPEEKKPYILGIDMENSCIPNDGHLWFSNYLKENVVKRNHNHTEETEARLEIHCKIVHSEEQLSPVYIRDMINTTSIKEQKRYSSHVVEKVVYGAYFILSMNRKLKPGEDQAEIEDVMNLIAKKKLGILKTDTLELRTLKDDQIECKLYSSMSKHGGADAYIGSVSLCAKKLLNFVSNIYEKNRTAELESLEIFVSSILKWEVESFSIKAEEERIKELSENIMKKYLQLKKGKYLATFPSLNDIIEEFGSLLSSLTKQLELYLKELNTRQYLPSKTEKIERFLEYIIEWLVQRGRDQMILNQILFQQKLEIPVVQYVADGINPMDGPCHMFILAVVSETEECITRIRNWIGNSEIFYCKRLFFLNQESQSQFKLMQDFKNFIDEANQKGTRFCIGLGDHEFGDTDGKVVCWPATGIEQLSNNMNNTEGIEAGAGSYVSTCPKEEGATWDLDENHEENRKKNTKKDTNRILLDSSISIAERFKQCSKLLSEDSTPRVYMLNGNDISVPSSESGSRWLEIGHRSPSSASSHKVIILMGATGCGKSTLINGMINHMLGVQWEDPHRFRIVHEKGPSNQAFSQTSSVTAYTIHHYPGMTIPYGLTLIDTPGYGDTNGIERDKEITKSIHQFISDTSGFLKDIHAICFVATSASSRLTTTEKYIFDSVLSIFGKDVKDNIRLLVTFGDNALPPVVEACREAHFPSINQQGKIIYNKFNNSVLFARNDQGPDSFDELYWQMGKDNFEIFFDMLQNMPAQNLSSTRQVIQSRLNLDKCFLDMEKQLEKCLKQIEDLENFKKKLKDYDHQKESNENFEIVVSGWFKQKVVLHWEGSKAYNCCKCNVTCLEPTENWIHYSRQFAGRRCPNYECENSCQHKWQSSYWEMEECRVKTTLKNIKEKYEEGVQKALTMQETISFCEEDLKISRNTAVNILNDAAKHVRALDSTALRSNALTPTDYLCLLKSRVNEERKPGYLARLSTLNDLQVALENGHLSSASVSTPHSPANWNVNKGSKKKNISLWNKFIDLLNTV